MNLIQNINFFLKITHSHGIIRRYFVVNGFDGALTMLGLMLGFFVNDVSDLRVVIGVCIGAAIALGISGISSAYVSETAERERFLKELEDAMIVDLQESAHGNAARWVPILIALVNGLSPFLISVVILIPLWLADTGFVLPVSPLLMSILVALLLIFLLGVFLGRTAGSSWLRSGIRTIVVALITIALIYLTVGS